MAREKQIMEYMDNHESITLPVVQELMECLQTTAITTLNKLMD